MNWYVNQEVVCVQSDDPQLIVDSIYEISAIRKSPCKCGGFDFDVSLPCSGGIECECGYIEESNIMWYHESQFRPLDELCNISELTEILTETKPFEV